LDRAGPQKSGPFRALLHSRKMSRHC
jgi:hypothetical protein